MIDSKKRKIFSVSILAYSLTGNNKCELCRKIYMSVDPPRHQHSIQGRENIQMSSLPKKIVRKDNITLRSTHLQTLLDRKQNTSEDQLSRCKRIN